MKRILIVFMGLLLLVGCSQNQSYATCTFCGEQVTEDSKYCSECGRGISEPQEQSVDYTILDSGICNSNVSWEIRSDGTLYIFGNGTIPNYESREVDGEIAPWRASVVCSEITDVLISDGITGVGEEAFRGLSLTSIIFGHNVIAYDYCLNGTYYVKTAYIPSSMKDIRSFLTDSDFGYPMTIYYEGTEEEWNSRIRDYMGEYNDYTVYYNSDF